MKAEKLKKKYSFTEENLKKIQDAVAKAEKTRIEQDYQLLRTWS